MALAVVFSGGVLGCSGSSSGDGGGGGSDGGSGGPAVVPIVDPDKQQVAGRIIGTDGNGVSGVTIAVGSASATSNGLGYFNLALPAGDHTLQLTAPGYVPSQKRVTVLEGTTRMETRLMKRAPAVPLDAAAGGAVDGMRGAKMVAPPGAFVTADGAAVEGEVAVHLTAFDPSVPEELAAFPGDLTAETTGGDTTKLESFGVLDVTVMQGEQTLQVKEGMLLDIEVPVPVGATEPPATIALWSFDEERALWVEQGTATYNADTRTYQGQIPHMSPWNCDQPLATTCIQGTVVEKDSGEPVSGGLVTSSGTDYFGMSETFTDATGTFCIPVKTGGKAVITAVHPAGGGTQKNVDGPLDVVPVELCRAGNCSPALVLEEPCEVVPQQVIGPDGSTVDCAAIGNPLEGSCAAGLGTLFSCWQPSGACTLSTGGIRFENGARLEFTGGVGSAQGSYVGPNGQTCGTFEADTDTTPVESRLTVNGQTYRVISADDSGSTVIHCPNGESVTLTSTEQAAVSACTGTSTETCTFDGEFPGSCQGDSDCPSGTTCCSVQGISVCVPPDVCAQAGQ